MKIRKFDDPVTVQYLLDWMEEVEEDPIVDGPFILTKEQSFEWTQKLSDRIKQRIIDDYNVDSWEEMDYQDVALGFTDRDEEMEEVLTPFVDLVNKYKLKEY